MDSLKRKKIPPRPLPPEPAPLPVFQPAQEPLPEPEIVLRNPALEPILIPKKVAKPRPEKKHVLLRTLGFVFIVFLMSVSFLLWKGFRTVEGIQIQGTTERAPTLTQKLRALQATFLPGESAPLKGQERGRINILLLGKAGEGLPGENLTDTLMLASIDTKTNAIALLSLPRDLYIENPEFKEAGKINTFYQKSRNDEKEPLGLLKHSVTLITGEPVDYFFVLDFAGFENTIDALGGIEVDVPKDFYDPRYPGKNYSYEIFEIKKGWQQLDGATALKYVRERNDDPEGDFGRSKRQQQVLQAVKDKAQSPGTYLNFFRVNKLLEGVKGNVETDITLSEMQSFYELSQKLDTDNVSTSVIDAWKPESLLRVDSVTLGGTRAFTLVPRTGNWQETRELAQNIFDVSALQKRKAAIQKEDASVTIYDSGENLQSANKLAQYIERELGLDARVQYTPQLEPGIYPAMLMALAPKGKPVSFEELQKKLPVKKGEELPAFLKTAPESDFILVMDSVLARSFQNADEFYSEGGQL